MDNATRLCAAKPWDHLPADVGWVRDVLVMRAPQAVIACGASAERAIVGTWDGPLLVLPHPAHYPSKAAYLWATRWDVESRLAVRSPHANKIVFEELTDEYIMVDQYDWPLICITQDVKRDLWYPTLYVKHPHVEGAYRYRLHYMYPFHSRENSVEYARHEFLANVDRHSNHEVQLRLECVFEWDGEGSPYPGPWEFPTEVVIV